jgi:uroporphyrinogen-III synthase
LLQSTFAIHTVNVVHLVRNLIDEFSTCVKGIVIGERREGRTLSRYSDDEREAVEQNRRVLVTRAVEQAGELVDALRAAGLEPVLVPTLTFREVDFGELDAALQRLADFDWLVLTSMNAVKALRARLGDSSHGLPAALQIAVVGNATGKAVEAEFAGREADLVSPEPIADSLAKSLAGRAKGFDGSPQRFLVVRAQEGREVIEQALKAAGAEVTVAPAYRTEAPPESLAALRQMAASLQWPAAATFTSPSSARNLLGLLERAGAELPDFVRRVAIGPVTAKAMQELGIPAHVTALEASPKAMSDAVLTALGSPLASPRHFETGGSHSA